MTNSREIPISAKSHYVGDLFTRATFRIPDFQRPYAWGDDQLQDLWDDIQDSASVQNPLPHFFGTLLTTESDGSPLGTDGLEVLDGQQRLTTFMLLLIALDRNLEELESPDASKAVREGAAELRAKIRTALLKDGGLRRLRLRSDDDHLLANLQNGNPASGPVGHAFTFLRDRVTEYLEGSSNKFEDLKRLTESVLDRSVVIHAHCRAGFDPFVVFATLNATGLPLTASQILRARSLGLVDKLGGHVPSLTSSAWNEIEALQSEADRFLQTFLVLRKGTRIQMKEVVRHFDRDVLRSKRLPADQEKHFEELAHELRRLIPLYKQLVDGSWPSQSKGEAPSDWHAYRVRLIVRVLKVRQLLPLLVATASRDDLDFTDVLDLLERAAFAALISFDNQTRWGEASFDLASRVYQGTLTFDELRSEIASFFANQLTDPAGRFSARLPERLRYQNNRKTLIRYFLTALNDWGFPELDKPSDEPDIQAVWVLSDIHLDHISATRADDGVSDSDKDRIGNLTPLKGKHNVAAGAKAFAMKRTSYQASPLTITRALANESDWGADQIDRREAAMVEFAANLFCRDLPARTRFRDVTRAPT